MRFHLIDRIESWQPYESITARKATSRQEEPWPAEQPHARETGGLPFGLALEALCQAGTWLIMLSTDHRRRAALLTVGEAVAHRPVRPGEVLRMAATVVSRNEDAAVMDGTVTADGEPALTARGIMCALIDAERLADPAGTARHARQLLGEGPVS
jgi:3-hydroxyacyl-[acyl-carrier-protein] dehydratase